MLVGLLGSMRTLGLKCRNGSYMEISNLQGSEKFFLILLFFFKALGELLTGYSYLLSSFSKEINLRVYV